MLDEIENKFRVLMAASTMSFDMYKYSGHIAQQTLPCTIYGIYNQRTGTIILTEVWCDDHILVGAGSLTADDRERFYEALQAAVVTQFD